MMMRIARSTFLIAASLAVVQAEQNSEDPITRPMTLSEKIKLQKSYENENLLPGTLDLDNRVVGGNQVTSTSKYKFFCEWESSKCGASLIHDDIALSAAHCESESNPFSTRLFINGIVTKGGIFRNIEQQHSHPLYNGNSKDYDFMILKLHKSAKENEDGSTTGAETITLNTDDTVPAVGDKLMAVGFGLTQEGGSQTSTTLQDVEVEYVDDDICKDQYGASTYVADLMFCAGVSGGGKDTCQGDSGGPIIDEATKTQMGVVSFGSGCARASHNGVYARVSAVTDWIDDMVCKLSDDPPSGCKTQGNPQNGNGKLTITFTYDSYPKETGIIFVRVVDKGNDPDETLFFQPYQDSAPQSGATVDFSFENLQKGDYKLLVGDQGRDGACCGYGEGGFSITDDKNQAEIYKNGGEFGEFIQVDLTVEPNGDITYNGEKTDYENSWEGASVVPNYPQSVDQAWPGDIPLNKKAIFVNIKFDKYPAEIKFNIAKRNGNSNNFNTVVKSFDGSQLGVSNDLVVTKVENLDAGWYRLALTDDGEDGFCCNFRRGWGTMTGFLKATRKSGLVWGTNGEVGAGVTVYFEMDNDGYVRRITDNLSSI